MIKVRNLDTSDPIQPCPIIPSPTSDPPQPEPVIPGPDNSLSDLQKQAILALCGFITTLSMITLTQAHQALATMA